MTQRTDLEHAILGIVAKFGPCTTYTVRRHFEISPTQYFSGSTGSIYPAMRRLEKAGLIARRPDKRGRQKRVIHSITNEGTEALRAWLTPPFDESALGPPHDPIRTRFYFLTEISPRERKRFLSRTIADLEKRLDVLQEYVANYAADEEAHISHLAARGCVHAVEAQIAWLREVGTEL